LNYWDRGRPLRTFHAHAAVWRRLKNQTGSWPVLSIATYALRFILLLARMVTIVWCGDVIHGWTRHQVGLAFAIILAPVVFIWFIIERMAWNHDLRKAGVSSEKLINRDYTL
jgi:ABC-type uncharacterized transport system permease subunit